MSLLLLLCALVPKIIPDIIPAAQASDSQDLWALVVVGSLGATFSNDAKYMNHTLTENCGIANDHICYLNYSQSTKNNVRDAIRKWLNTSSDGNDIIFIYISSHGGGYHREAGFEGTGTTSVLARIETVASDEGTEIPESTFKHWVWKLNEEIYYDPEDYDRLTAGKFDNDTYIEVDLGDNNVVDGQLWLDDLDGDGQYDDLFFDPDFDNQCDLAFDADVDHDGNLTEEDFPIESDGEANANFPTDILGVPYEIEISRRLIVGFDLNKDNDTDDWVGVDEGIEVQDGCYWDDELKEDLNTLNYSKLILVKQGCIEGNMSCFTGGLIDDISAPNRIIMTATNETSFSFGDDDGVGQPGFGYSEWSERFIDALHGVRTHIVGQNIVDDPQYPVDADTNNDNHTSMWEAWDHAWNTDTRRVDGSETPWIDDNGNERPTYGNASDELDATDWLFSMETYFGFDNLITVDTTDDGIVDIFDLVFAALHFGAEKGEPLYEPRVDVNGDGQIDILDVTWIANSWAKYYPKEFSLSMPLGLGTTSISVYPSSITTYKGETFSVNMTVNDVTNMYGWELQLYWNKAVLNCTNAQIRIPAGWSGNTLEAGAGIENTLNATHGRYWKALSALSPAPAFNGSMAIVTLAFEAKAAGTTKLDLENTKISDNNASAISHSANDGSVTVLPHTLFMRGDQHTINLLTAYKLWKPQSNTMRYYYESKPIYELSAEWGIQVWKRSQSGTETPISADKVAQVTRTIPGQGLQSATWNCPETTLSSTDAIVVRVYQRFEGFSWQLAATFITPRLGATKLNATTWTVYYYTKLYWTTSPSLQSKAYFYWGTTIYNSRTQNIEYT